MANVLLAHPNVADSGTLSGGNWQVALNNLKDRRLSRVARSATALKADTQFVLDLGQSRLVSVIAVVRHNLSTSAKWRLRVANAPSFASPVYDNAVIYPPDGSASLQMDFLAPSYLAWDPDWPLAWPTLFPPASLEWEDDNFWTGSITEEERKQYPSMLLVILPKPTAGRYIKIEIDDESNPDGYVEFGRLFVSRAWQPLNNANWGASIGWETDTTTQRALSGTPYFDRKDGRRVTRFELGYLSRDEALGQVFELQRRAGIDGEILLVWDKDDPINLLRQSYLGHQRQLNPIARAFVGNHSNAFEIEEL
ncbi:hypothetical protein K2O51_23315 [Cupriavidus pinatubonensis]|uniref:hypothetical protein n=1 Tax=Cupriavidus pinatubonensis TaxID=248026 RepID=UPI001C73C484|nr:hypothetical protein [Cupriavidus pinatubonensis]QYY30302.1 hypothetical protein K2O51_23315 [Cupriavidus pinatubonensis]